MYAARWMLLSMIPNNISTRYNNSGPGVVQTGTEAGDSCELESVVGPAGYVEGDESEREGDGWEEIDVALGYVVSWRDGRVLSEDEIRRIYVKTSNRFQIMEDTTDHEDDTRDERIFMGDSIIRKTDGTVCGKKTKTTTVCLPGARVEDVRCWVQVRGGGGSILVHVGTNDAWSERRVKLSVNVHALLLAISKFSGRNSQCGYYIAVRISAEGGNHCQNLCRHECALIIDGALSPCWSFAQYDRYID